jgi:hypothetical protein
MLQRVKSADEQSAPSITAHFMFASVNFARESTAQVMFAASKSQRQNEQSLASAKDRRARVSCAPSKVHASSSLEEKFAPTKFAEEKSTLRRVMWVAVMSLQALLFT